MDVARQSWGLASAFCSSERWTLELVLKLTCVVPTFLTSTANFQVHLLGLKLTSRRLPPQRFPIKFYPPIALHFPTLSPLRLFVLRYLQILESTWNEEGSICPSLSIRSFKFRVSYSISLTSWTRNKITMSKLDHQRQWSRWHFESTRLEKFRLRGVEYNIQQNGSKPKSQDPQRWIKARKIWGRKRPKPHIHYSRMSRVSNGVANVGLQ